MKVQHFETLAIHASDNKADPTGAHAVPVHRTSAYLFKNTAHAADLFALKVPGNIYTRLGNPTQDSLEARLALLENGGKPGASALALASGTSAIFYAIINLAGQGDEIVAANNLYGGTYTMFSAILPQFGITTRFVHPGKLDEFAAAITPRTRAVYVETVGNPSLDMVDLEALATLAHSHGLPLVVDSTFTTPYLCRPLEHGADIVVHSLTKWIGGHGTGLGGVVVDSGKFDWTNPRFTLYNEPDNGYHSLRWGHDLGGLPPFITRMRTVPLRNLGACIAPDNSWLFLQGLETLSLRMERHSSNALAVATFLAKHPKVAWVRYPGLESDPAYPLACKYLPRGAGGMVVFGIKGTDAGGGKAAGQRFIDALQLFSQVANVGDAKSLSLHPASTTHSQLSNKEQEEAGLKPELVRLSIGIEHVDDILEDLEQGLKKA